MTREDALKASQALEKIEMLELFMDEIEKVFKDFPEMNDIHGLVMIPLKCELKKREATLADL